MVDLTGYKLTFDDEFNTRSISPTGAGTTYADTRPEYRLSGGKADVGFGRSSFVDSSSGYDPFSAQNGALAITAVPDRTQYGVAGNWESGLISTQGNFSQTYGYFEMRADLSNNPNAWDAFWLLPNQQSSASNTDASHQELDVVEHYGNNDKGVYSTIHTTDPQNGIPWQDNRQVYSETSNPSGYHTYGVNWQADKISFYVDGQLQGAQATPSDMHSPMFILANLAVQNTAGSTGSPITSNIDYIRAYSNDPNAVAVGQSAVSAPDGHDPGLYGATAASTGPTSAAQPSTSSSIGTTTSATASAPTPTSATSAANSTSTTGTTTPTASTTGSTSGTTSASHATTSGSTDTSGTTASVTGSTGSVTNATGATSTSSSSPAATTGTTNPTSGSTGSTVGTANTTTGSAGTSNPVSTAGAASTSSASSLDGPQSASGPTAGSAATIGTTASTGAAGAVQPAATVETSSSLNPVSATNPTTNSAGPATSNLTAPSQITSNATSNPTAGSTTTVGSTAPATSTAGADTSSAASTGSVNSTGLTNTVSSTGTPNSATTAAPDVNSSVSTSSNGRTHHYQTFSVSEDDRKAAIAMMEKASQASGGQPTSNGSAHSFHDAMFHFW